jgi:membrane protease YdiL (CAAX protease family)
VAKAASSPPGKYGALLLRTLPLPLACYPLWLILSNIHDAIFALHNDLLDALYLLTQIGAVYGAMLYLAWIGTLLFTKRADVTWRDMGFAPYRVHFWSILWFVISFVYLVVFNIIWQVISTYWHIDLLNRNTLLTNYTDMPLSQWSMVLIIGVIGPLGEEVLFRGLLFRTLDVVLTRYLARHLSKSLASYIALICAVCISAGIFATLHFDTSSFPVYFAIGAVLALWVRYTRSLWPSWVLHMTFNSLFIAHLLVH